MEVPLTFYLIAPIYLSVIFKDLIPCHGSILLNRSSFPAEFVFGTAASAYQYEGAAHIEGRKPSIWDTFAMDQPEKILDHSNGDVADNFYFRYKEDIALMKEVGFDSFRFSISWSRILPLGKISGGVNQQGVDFYNNLIDELVSNGIKPVVTLFHWDSPQALEDEYGGFLSPKIVKDFGEYAEFCFKKFGDRVKYWITLNEPQSVCEGGYATGTKAPGRCSNYIGSCPAGNSATEPYIVAHHLILSHATAVKLYKENYQASQNGLIGITLSSIWAVPKFQTVASKKAAFTALDFIFGWFFNPIAHGNYPKSMQYLVGDRLPNFTTSQSEMVKGSIDFLGLNYYTASYADHLTSYSNTSLSYTTDSRVNLTKEKNGIPIGQPTGSRWLYIYPKGIRQLLLYIKRKYNPPAPIYITENGLGDVNSSSWPISYALNDSWRIKFYQRHLSYLLEAIKNGVEVKGYFAWSFLDNFEWGDGYTTRFGITYVHYEDGLRRYLKNSALWFKNFLRNKTDNIVSTASSFKLYSDQ
ncbi:putative Beta-glucosidase [Melia azedarach]|uniref:Beta-glucosidase n=2 Tax=Melia azedarach TaxID=155640 RepID=A0ACC1XK38_MELAZ|nr:putative Beta-glucosidase [Melia azedarach]KAJ4711679.1 putative Beta-glucosidase [Melia azedarach]